MRTGWNMLDTKSRFVASFLIYGLATYPITALLVATNKDSYTTIPFKDFSYLKPCEITYKEAEEFVSHNQNIDSLTKEEFEQAKLAYACTKFEEDFYNQLELIVEKSVKDSIKKRNKEAP